MPLVVSISARLSLRPSGRSDRLRVSCVGLWRGLAQGVDARCECSILPPVQAHRELLETDEKGHLRIAPNLPPLAKVEAIFLVLGPDQPRASRQPPPELAKLRITGDVIAPVLDEKDCGIGA